MRAPISRRSRRQLAAFDPALLQRQRVLVASKADVALDSRRQALVRAAAEKGLPYLEISSATRAGIRELVGHLARCLATTTGPDASGGR